MSFALTVQWFAGEQGIELLVWHENRGIPSGDIALAIEAWLERFKSNETNSRVNYLS